MTFARYTSLVLAVFVLGIAFGQPASAQTPLPEALDPATLIPVRLTRSTQCVCSDAGMFADWLWERESAAN